MTFSGFNNGLSGHLFPPGLILVCMWYRYVLLHIGVKYSIGKGDVKSRGHFLVLELQYRSQANSRQLSGGPKEMPPLFEDLKGVISNQALLFGPTEKAAKGNQPPVDG